MNKSLVIEIILAVMAIIGLVVMIVLIARDQTVSMDVFLAGSYSLTFSIGSYVMRKNREEKQRRDN